MSRKQKKNEIDIDYIIRNRRHRFTFNDINTPISLMVIILLGTTILILNLSRYGALVVIALICAFIFLIIKVFLSVSKRMLFTSVRTDKTQDSNIICIYNCLNFFHLPIYKGKEDNVFHTVFTDNVKTQNLVSLYVIALENEILINFRNRNSFEIFNFSHSKQHEIIQFFEKAGKSNSVASSKEVFMRSNQL